MERDKNLIYVILDYFWNHSDPGCLSIIDEKCFDSGKFLNQNLKTVASHFDVARRGGLVDGEIKLDNASSDYKPIIDYHGMTLKGFEFMEQMELQMNRSMSR